jgi:hypothetical protein
MLQDQQANSEKVLKASLAYSNSTSISQAHLITTSRA